MTNVTVVEVTEALILQVAMEMATDLYTPKEVLDKYQLTTKQFKVFSKTAQFKQFFTEARAAWHATDNSTERIKAKGNMLVEDLMIDLYTRAKDSGTPHEAMVKLVKQIVDLSNVAPKKEVAQPTGDRFVINMDFGASATPQTMAAEVVAVQEQDVKSVSTDG